MRNGFTTGLIVGGMIGASVSMMMSTDMMKSRNKRKMMKTGRNLVRKTSHLIGDVVDLFH